MIATVGKSVLFILVGVALRSIVPSIFDNTATRRCTDIYRGSAPVVYSLAQLWQHAPTPEPGLAHLTLAGHVHHGLTKFEVWRQTLAPGVSTPIHSHDCEELNLILQGTGHLYIRSESGQVNEHRVGVNDTVLAPPGAIYQMKNLGQEALSLLVVIGCAPAHIDTYTSFDEERSSAHRIHPMPWDKDCPPELPAAFSGLSTNSSQEAQS